MKFDVWPGTMKKDKKKKRKETTTKKGFGAFTSWLKRSKRHIYTFCSVNGYCEIVPIV